LEAIGGDLVHRFWAFFVSGLDGAMQGTCKKVGPFLERFDLLKDALGSFLDGLIDMFSEVVDALSFLLCPRESLGTLRFLCDSLDGVAM